jgi:hypothetical protein
MGLIGMAARTAVVAGTATTVSNRVSRRQANRWAAKGETLPQGYAYGYNVEGQPQQPPPPQYQQAPAYAEPASLPPADDGDDMIEQLTKLGKLHDAGILTDEEFSAQKAKILG